jgi:hypothetical protein
MAGATYRDKTLQVQLCTDGGAPSPALDDQHYGRTSVCLWEEPDPFSVLESTAADNHDATNIVAWTRPVDLDGVSWATILDSGIRGALAANDPEAGLSSAQGDIRPDRATEGDNQ